MQTDASVCEAVLYFLLILIGASVLTYLLFAPQEVPVSNGLRPDPTQPAKPRSDTELNLLAIEEALARYRVVEHGRDSAARCREAGAVAAAFLQAGGEEPYARWKDIEAKACASASKESTELPMKRK
jgi:hypothetical protein